MPSAAHEIQTIFILRAIADIARHHGENLSTIEGRLACVEVFALGEPETNGRMNLGYYASRALLSKFTKDASTFLTNAELRPHPLRLSAVSFLKLHRDLEPSSPRGWPPARSRLSAQLAARWSILSS